MEKLKIFLELCKSKVTGEHALEIVIVIGTHLVALAIGVLFHDLYERAKRRRREKHGPITGTWSVKIFPTGKPIGCQPIKQDIAACKQDEQFVTAKIIRELPSEAAGKEWIFSGIYIGRILCGHFQCAKDPDSCGTIFLKKGATENEFSGHYVRARTEPNQDGTERIKADPTRVEWHREK